MDDETGDMMHRTVHRHHRVANGKLRLAGLGYRTIVLN